MRLGRADGAHVLWAALKRKQHLLDTDRSEQALVEAAVCSTQEVRSYTLRSFDAAHVT